MQGKSIEQIVLETTAAAGPRGRSRGTINQKKKGDWVWWIS